ncbi:HIT family protein [Candidatus Woesearchaeota archaeon]|nr:HIT family protein [Candidatus Woesearchaeota archaeon]
MDCIFCKIISKKIPSDIVYEDDNTIAFLDISPVNKGHTLIVPKKHSENLIASEEKDIHESLNVIKKITPAIIKTVKADGWNLGVNNGPAAGQIVKHTHFHIIPRFSNDGLKHWHKKSYAEAESKQIAEAIRKEI